MLDKKKKIVIVGATSSMAEHCARLWAQEAFVDFVLIGRATSRLDRIAEDLKVRNPKSDIKLVQADFLDPLLIQASVDEVLAAGAVDIVLIAHGSLPDQVDCQQNLSVCCEALEINAISPVLYGEAFARHMEQANRGTIALIGSVAGDRGRKSNYVYGAAKGLVDRYAQGLQHRFAKTGVSVVLIKPGPTETPMTAHLTEQGMKLASVEDAAKDIVNAIDRKKPVAYIPRKWRLIMLIIVHMPQFIFNKLNI